MTRVSLYCIATQLTNSAKSKETIMTPIEYLTVAISAVAIVARIAIFVRNPSVTAPSELWLADAPTELWMGEYARPKKAA